MTTGLNPAIYTIVRETKYESNNYKVSVGFVKADELPQYIVINKETGVVEFNHEVLSFVREWVAHFQQRLTDLDNGKTASPDTITSPMSSFN